MTIFLTKLDYVCFYFNFSFLSFVYFYYYYFGYNVYVWVSSVSWLGYGFLLISLFNLSVCIIRNQRVLKYNTPVKVFLNENNNSRNYNGCEETPLVDFLRTKNDVSETKIVSLYFYTRFGSILIEQYLDFCRVHIFS